MARVWWWALAGGRWLVACGGPGADPDLASGADGSYLHVAPPEDPLDPGDGFAEIMMYFHVTRVHDWFVSEQGVDWMDWRVPAVVNLGEWGEGAWQPFDNAAFMPRESAAIVGFDVGDLPGAIVFG